MLKKRIFGPIILYVAGFCGEVNIVSKQVNTNCFALCYISGIMSNIRVKRLFLVLPYY